MRVRIADLTLDARNARTHPEQSIDALAKSLARFGQTRPVVINRSNLVIAGNGTVVAAHKLGWEEVEAVVTDLDVDEQRAYAIADNRIPELSGWDERLLVQELRRLDADLLAATAFTDAEVGALDVRLADEEARHQARAAVHEAPPERPSIAYTIVFDTERQKALWDAFAAALHPSYPDLATTGSRVIQCLLDKGELQAHTG